MALCAGSLSHGARAAGLSKPMETARTQSLSSVLHSGEARHLQPSPAARRQFRVTVRAALPVRVDTEANAEPFESRNFLSGRFETGSRDEPARPYEEGRHEFPQWTGGGPLSSVLNAMISFGPLYSLMKVGARQVLISTAERNNVPWRRIVEELRSDPQLRAEKEALERPLVYPDYYLRPFHAYDEGNLCWEAAYEVEPATLSMCQRAIPWAPSPQAAAAVLRSAWLEAIREHHQRHSGGLPLRSVLDCGCSAGVSTRCLAEAFPEAHVTGLDASPFFLAVASLRAKQQAQAQGPAATSRLSWRHALAEDTGLPDASVALVSFAFVFHECPPAAIHSMLQEARRVLQEGGTVAITDNSPKSKVIQELPTPVATLMKSTEPHADAYYQLRLEALLEELGFRHVSSQLTDPRHRTVTATK